MTHDPVAAYLNTLAEGSRGTMKGALGTIAAFFGSTIERFEWHKLRYEKVQALRTHLASSYKSRTVNKALAALRGVMKAAWRLKIMPTDAYHRAADVKVVRISEKLAGRMLSMAELRALLNYPDDEPHAMRDTSVIALMYAAGLRRFEVAKIRCCDYERATGVLTVRGKGKKIREIKIQQSWRKPVENWLETSGRSGEQAMFVSGKKETALGLTTVSKLIEDRRVKAGVAPFTSHDMRRTFISNLIDSGADLVVVKKIVGHESVNTTAAYDRRGRDAQDAAIEKLEGL